MFTKRVSLFAGHYGSGKTNIAVNYALALRAQGRKVTVADMDIVNPYFRTKDSERLFTERGIRLVSSAYANTNLDIPALPAEFYALLARKEEYAVLDIGGDDRGAVALGRYVPQILEENDYDMFFVVNFYRPLTQTPEDALEAMREVEAAAGLPFTSILNNSNLGEETTADTVLATVEKANVLSRLSGLPVSAVCAERQVAEKLSGRVPNLFPMQLQEKVFTIRGGESTWQN